MLKVSCMALITLAIIATIHTSEDIEKNIHTEPTISAIQQGSHHEADFDPVDLNMILWELNTRLNARREENKIIAQKLVETQKLVADSGCKCITPSSKRDEARNE
jgi:hypothetical protein